MDKLNTNTFVVTCVNENEDGSAIIEVESDPEMSKVFLSEGINFLLLKGILEGSTSDILRWAQLGKNSDMNINRHE